MKKIFLLSLCYFALTTHAQAESSHPDRNERQLTVKQAACTLQAVAIAKAIGYVKENTPADIIISVETYSAPSDDYETQEQHIWTGTAELVVNMLPNYYGDGNCHFSSSYILRD